MRHRFFGIDANRVSQPLWRVGMRSGRRQGTLAAKNEPSNPFKNPRKSPSPTINQGPKKGEQSSKSRSKSSPPPPPGGSRSKSRPPAPPSGKRTAPAPAPPTGSESSDSNAKSSSPARAGKSVGLRKKTEKVKVKTEPKKAETGTKTDQKARQLIEASRTKVIETQPAKPGTLPPAKKEPYNPFKKNQPKRTPSPPRRGGYKGKKRKKPQPPSKRVKKLHRGKYMEFKYDVRKILEEEDVAEEFRSNVLGQTWAKGERQGVSEAKAFLDEKVAEEIISEKCSIKIIKLIDSLTTRR